MARVLITEPLAPSANAVLSAAGHEVDEQIGLSPEQLLEAVKGADALIGQLRYRMPDESARRLTALFGPPAGAIDRDQYARARQAVVSAQA